MAKNTVEVIIKARDQATKELTKFQSKFKTGMTSLRKSIFSLKGAVIALAGAAGMGLLAKSLIGVASEVENFTLRLKFLMGSQEAAAKKMQFFQEVASKVPFGLKEIINAGVTLEAMGADSEKWIRPLIDMAAVMGVQLPVAAENLGRSLAAGLAASEIFREKGIRSMIEEFHGLNDITKLSVKEQGKLFFTFVTESKKIAGAADEMKDTWTGIVSMIGDSVYKIKQSIMDAGIYEAIKVGLENVKDALDAFTGEDIEKFRKTIQDTAIAVLSAFELAMEGIAIAMDGAKYALAGFAAFEVGWHKFLEFVTFGNEKIKESKKAWVEFGTTVIITTDTAKEKIIGLKDAVVNAFLPATVKFVEGSKEVTKSTQELGEETTKTKEETEKLTKSFYELHDVSMFAQEDIYNLAMGMTLWQSGLYNVQGALIATHTQLENFRKKMPETKKTVDDFSGYAEGAFMDLAFTAGTSFNKIIKEFSIMVMKLMAKAAILSTIKWIFGAKEGGFLTRHDIPFIGRFMGQGGTVLPAMQEGGAIVRKPTVVSPGVIAGEAGPEIIPLSKMKMMGETNIYLTLQHPLVDDRKYWNDLIKNKINPAIRRVAHDISTSRTLEI